MLRDRVGDWVRLRVRFRDRDRVRVRDRVRAHDKYNTSAKGRTTNTTHHNITKT